MKARKPDLTTKAPGKATGPDAEAIKKFIDGGEASATEIEVAEVQVNFNLRMPKSLRRRLRLVANGYEEKTTMNDLIVQAINSHLDALEEEQKDQ